MSKHSLTASVVPKPTEMAWIRRRLLQTNPKVMRFGVLHLVQGEDAAPLGIFEVDQDAEIETEANRIAGEVQESVGGHSEAFAGATQAYQLVAYSVGDGIAGQLTFRRHCPGDAIADTPSDPPTATGALAQTMRQTEMFARILLATINSTVGSLAAENERLSLRAERADQQTLQVITLVQELLDIKGTKQIEEAKMATSEARKDRLLRMVEKAVVPALEEKLTGAGPLNQLIDTLTEDQAMKLLQADILTVPQIEAIAKLMERRAEKAKELAAHEKT